MDCPTRWENIGRTLEFIAHEMLLTGGGRHDMRHIEPTWEALTRFHFAEELRLRGEIDSAARKIAKEQRSPGSISPAARYYLALRSGAPWIFPACYFRRRRLPPRSARFPMIGATSVLSSGF